MILRFAFFILPLAMISALAGCSSVPIPSLPSLPWSASAAQSNPTAEALFNEGMTYLQNKKYALAIDRFQRVKAEFPFSAELVPAELKLAEAYYLNKQYPEATAAFKEFQALHPTNENIPSVIYHLGLIHFDQFTSSDRDQKMTGLAKGYFEEVVKNHSASPYAQLAREKLAKCMEYLAQHHFGIAQFYLREKKFPAARERLEEVLRSYHNTPTAVRSLYHLGESYRMEGNSVKAALAYEALIQHYPTSPLAREAQTRLAQVEQQKQDPLAILLMRDGRPGFVPPPGSETSDGLAQKSGTRDLKDLNLVAKNEVVYEEPGGEKGLFRRVLDTINPFASSSDNKAIEPRSIEASQPQSDGFFSSAWRSVNPFAKEEKGKVEFEASRDPQLIASIDESLEDSGVAVARNPLSSAQKTKPTGANTQWPIEEGKLKPPAADLPQIAEASPPPPADTTKLIGSIDASLKKAGVESAAGPPQTPAIDPRFQASKTTTAEEMDERAAASPSSTSASELLVGIDKTLKQKGMDLGKTDIAPPTSSATKRMEEPRRTQPPSQKIELDAKLTSEKKPLFLDAGEYRAQEPSKEGEAAQKQESLQGTIQSEPSPAEPVGGLPQAVVKGPPQQQQQKSSEKPAEKNRLPLEDEPKGVFDQIREDFKALGNLLNPFSW